jgi:hypothetical protein
LISEAWPSSRGPVNQLVSRVLDRIEQSTRDPAVTASAAARFVYRLSLQLAENRVLYKARIRYSYA